MLKPRKKWELGRRAAFGLFLSLFFFHVTPFSYAITHAMIHQNGVHHQHDGVPEQHSMADHHAGDVHDLRLGNVSLTVEGAHRSATQVLSAAVLPLFEAVFHSLPDPAPPPLRGHDPGDEVRPVLSALYLASSPLRAPPSA